MSVIHRELYMWYVRGSMYVFMYLYKYVCTYDVCMYYVTKSTHMDVRRHEVVLIVYEGMGLVYTYT